MPDLAEAAFRSPFGESAHGVLPLYWQRTDTETIGDRVSMGRGRNNHQRIEVRVVCPSGREVRARMPALHPYGKLTPEERRVKVVDVLGEVWAAVCVRRSEEDTRPEEEHPGHSRL